ncbi:MAG: hypothetical protein ACI8X5_003361 [Planctomycetota bacterium]|jgi:hypothetical protein
MIREFTRALVFTGATFAIGGSLSAAPEIPAVGTPAPAIEAATWFNHIGKAPSVEGLGGQAILIEFWATW